VKLDHARILLVNPSGRQSVAFEDVSMIFERLNDVHKKLTLAVDPARGRVARDRSRSGA
jgi:hypothetical protein